MRAFVVLVVAFAALAAFATGPGRSAAHAAANFAARTARSAAVGVLRQVAAARGGVGSNSYALEPLDAAAAAPPRATEAASRRSPASSADQAATPGNTATPSPDPGTPSSPSPAAAAATPTTAPTPTYRFIYRASPSPVATPFPGPGAPQIFEIDVTDQYLATPGRLDVRVVTNPEVQTVTAGTEGYFVTIPRVGPGLFGGTRVVDRVPNFLKNKLFDIDFIATVSNGRTADVVLQLGLK